MNILSAAVSVVRSIYVFPIMIYRRFLSPLKGAPCCRFTPTCSQYAIDAVKEWGIVAGTGLAVWRIARCNPFCNGGYDPVPECRCSFCKVTVKKQKSDVSQNNNADKTDADKTDEAEISVGNADWDEG